ncbi:hypothetical protein C8C76_101119 [Halanaerobium saccharolyticum]|uniref:Uncharacterized protein n=1 Tax=Halanaerobium saccharolyticum TaxID=43595 RepID=A0A2T5RT12_9FIRM|nr:hypothetical protein [Halanaerobium saccharolyticum]PTW03478.1 hypothetical protein C8C76_101119 [Halanaerobium saccharolyticum]
MATLNHYSRFKIKDTRFFIGCLFVLVLIVIIFSTNVKAFDNKLSFQRDIYNNTLNIKEIILIQNGSLSDLSYVSSSSKKDIEHRDLIKEGIQIQNQDIKLSYYRLKNQFYYISNNAIELINRINNYNNKDKFKDIKINNSVIDLNILELKYKTDLIQSNKTKHSLIFGFNYIQGKTIENRNYKVNLDITEHSNPFFETPLLVKGNSNNYFLHKDSENYGISLGLGGEIKLENNLDLTIYINNLLGFVKWEKMRYEYSKIDSDTAYLDEKGFINYDASIKGKWKEFDYEMDLPKALTIDLNKKIGSWVFVSELTAREYFLGDFSKKSYWSFKNSIVYDYKGNLFSIGFDVPNKLHLLSYKNNNLGFDLTFDNINLTKINGVGSRFYYSLKF